MTGPANASRNDARVHAWALGVALSIIFALHHAQRIYALYLAPSDEKLSGFAAAGAGFAIGAAVVRPLAPLSERVVPWSLFALAIAIGASSFAPFAAFPLGAWAPRVACACIAVTLTASVVAAVAAYRAAGRAAVALGVVPFVLRPIRLAGAMLLLIAVEAGAARVGFLLSGVFLAGVVVMLAIGYPILHGLLYGAPFPRLGVLRAAGVALAAVEVVSLGATGSLAPPSDLSRFSDEVVFRTDASGPTYTVVASPGGYELFSDGQLAVASLDEPRRTRALVEPALRLSPHARHVLLLNGGLGMVERDILRDARVEELVVVVAEPTRLDLARNLAFLAKRTERALDSPRLRVVLSEPLAWLAAERPDRYDVIIADFPWPLGYGEGKLYTRYAFSRLAARLANDGVVVVPGTSGFSAPDALAGIIATLESAGLRTGAYHVPVPTTGVASFVVGSRNAIDLAPPVGGTDLDFGVDLRTPERGRISTLHDQSVVTAFEDALETGRLSLTRVGDAPP